MAVPAWVGAAICLELVVLLLPNALLAILDHEANNHRMIRVTHNNGMVLKSRTVVFLDAPRLGLLWSQFLSKEQGLQAGDGHNHGPRLFHCQVNPWVRRRDVRVQASTNSAVHCTHSG